jgi:branched-chain amino acid transport system ATP-binding protein
MSAREPLLEVRDLHVGYGAVQALRGVSMSVEEGSIATLIGANGAGKSTVLKTLSGLIRPSAGSVRFRGEDLAGVPAHERVARGLVQCPEGRGVFPNLTVEENLDLGAYARRDRARIASDLAHVFALFPRLQDRRRQAAGTLSGGEQQMLAIGRALMARPLLLLLDEPSLGLAPQMVEVIFDTVTRINREGTTILLVEQNAHMALETASRAWVLETGRVVLEGVASEVRNDAKVKTAYLGEQAGT